MRSLAVVAFLLLLGGAAPAWASGQDVANQVSQRVMSPYCEGVTLHDCPSQKAAELRGRIARWARNGMTEEEIIHAMHPHPTFSEATMEAARATDGWLIHG